MLRIFLALVLSILFVSCKGGLETKEPDKSILLKEKRVVTIYVHGYDKIGYKKDGTYGEIEEGDIVLNMAQLMDSATIDDYNSSEFTNILATTTYYGNRAPLYYTQEDIDDIKMAGRGVPRYALIVAKFAKHVLKKSGADEINIVSGSMGSLVTRWLIEKDLEGLLSDKKIKKWLSIEGVIRGNYVASNPVVMESIKPFKKQPIETRDMKYSWVEKNLGGFIADNLNYQDIELGFISSTHDRDGYLSAFLSANGQLQPNDGVQLLKDTIFEATPNHNPIFATFHQDHLGIKKDRGAWAYVAIFLSNSKKRVRITLQNVTLHNLHESISFLNKRAEVVFQSRVYSNRVSEKFGIDDAINERELKSGVLKLTKFRKKGESRYIGEILFDGVVYSDEESLRLEIEGFELDKFAIYGVREPSFSSSKSSLGKSEIEIPIKSGLFEVSGRDFKGEVLVEVL